MSWTRADSAQELIIYPSCDRLAALNAAVATVDKAMMRATNDTELKAIIASDSLTNTLREK